MTENELKSVSGKRENPGAEKKVNSYEHQLKIAVNQMVKDARKNGIPIFIAYYSPTEGYVYNGAIPESITNPEADVSSEYGKFNAFLRVCMGYNKEEFLKSKVVKTYG